MLVRISIFIDRLNHVLGTIASWLVLLLVGTVCAEVFWRYYFNSSLFWAYDITYTLYAAFFMLGSAYALKAGAHIRSDFLYQKFPKRIKIAVDVFGYVFLFIPVLAVCFIYGIDSSISSYNNGQRSMTTRWAPPVWPLRSIIPATAALLILQCISETIKLMRDGEMEQENERC